MELHPDNPTGLVGIDFVEFSAADPSALDALFVAFGFSRVQRHREAQVDLYRQGDITFLVNREPNSFAAEFCRAHGPCASAMGWRFDNPVAAFEVALSRGARRYDGPSLYTGVPAIYGIGDSLIYFLGAEGLDRDFIAHDDPVSVPDKGFQSLDHLTNNVEKGTMERWSNFYKDIFGFREIRYFDIRGVKTGLTSYALRSPCDTFAIPINEGSEDKSQIEEYLREYRGAGIQHIAFLSDNLLDSLDKIDDSRIETLDIDDEYYASVFQRVPGVREDHGRIRAHNVLVDGDEEGYLLQIFTKNVIGPIFIEMIQREDHMSFGEGNFGALFRAIERDQEKRGVL